MVKGITLKFNKWQYQKDYRYINFMLAGHRSDTGNEKYNKQVNVTSIFIRTLIMISKEYIFLKNHEI